MTRDVAAERTRPNPGSSEARAQGCKCPRYDNCHGAGRHIDPVSGEPMFVINCDCPLHGLDTTTETSDE